MHKIDLLFPQAKFTTYNNVKMTVKSTNSERISQNSELSYWVELIHHVVNARPLQHDSNNFVHWKWIKFRKKIWKG